MVRDIGSAYRRPAFRYLPIYLSYLPDYETCLSIVSTQTKNNAWVIAWEWLVARRGLDPSWGFAMMTVFMVFRGYDIMNENEGMCCQWFYKNRCTLEYHE